MRFYGTEVRTWVLKITSLRRFTPPRSKNKGSNCKVHSKQLSHNKRSKHTTHDTQELHPIAINICNP